MQALALALLAGGLGAGLGGGCHGEFFELSPSADYDGDASTVDEGGADAMGPVTFAPTIQSDLDRLGCAAMGPCHGSSGVAMHLLANAADLASLQANYAEVKPRASSDTASALLQKALQGSGTPHAGAQPFSSTADPVYQRWLGWIRAGAPFATDGGTP